MRGKPKSGRRVFSSKLDVNGLNYAFWGARCGSIVMRLIFRNGQKGEIDAFVSHSWRDDGKAKWKTKTRTVFLHS